MKIEVRTIFSFCSVKEMTFCLSSIIWVGIIFSILLPPVGHAETSAQLKDQPHIKKAMQWWKKANDKMSQGNVDDEIDFMRKHLSLAKASTSDINLTEEKIQNILVSGYRNEAKRWLKLAKLRSPYKNVSDEIDYFYKYQYLSQWKLSKFQISEKELDTIRLEGFRSEATKWLRRAKTRNTSKSVSDEVTSFYDFMFKSGLTLDDFDTNKESLEIILKQGYESEAVRWLEMARSKRQKSDVQEEMKRFIEFSYRAKRSPNTFNLSALEGSEVNTLTPPELASSLLKDDKNNPNEEGGQRAPASKQDD